MFLDERVLLCTRGWVIAEQQSVHQYLSGGGSAGRLSQWQRNRREEGLGLAEVGFGQGADISDDLHWFEAEGSGRPRRLVAVKWAAAKTGGRG